MPRQYTKKSPYWSLKTQAALPPAPVVAPQPVASKPLISTTLEGLDYGGEPMSISGDKLQEVVVARRTGSGDSETFTSTKMYLRKDSNDKSFIRAMPLPYQYGEEGADIQDTVELCQRAYANVAIFKHTIDILADFCNSSHKLKGGTAKSKKFIKGWLEKLVNLDALKEKFFLEFWRSGNVFMFRVNGSGTTEAFSVPEQDSIKPLVTLPISYVFLNPSSLVLVNPVGGEPVFMKRVSDYEAAKARESSQFGNQFAAMDVAVNKAGEFANKGIRMVPFEKGKIAYVAARKMDYEPFAIPAFYSVLDDINFKLEMKSVDKAIHRVVNRVILLVTMGAKPEEGGVNAKNIEAMRNLLKTDAMGRALVSDYTTKADFIIPDLKKIVYKEKYEIVNEDIKDGLSSIMFGTEAKYGNVQTKALIFLERLKPAIAAFERFVNAEIAAACESAGLVKPPTLLLKKPSIQDPSVLQKVITRLYEVGITTPEDTIDSLESGELPDSSTLLDKQTKFVAEREDGKWNPVVGGVPAIESPDAAAAPAAKAPKTNTGRPKEKTMASVTLKDMTEVIREVTALERKLEEEMIRALGAKDDTLLNDTAETIILSSPIEEWQSLATKCMAEPTILDSMKTDPVIEAAAKENGTTEYEAALMENMKKLFAKNAKQV